MAENIRSHRGDEFRAVACALALGRILTELAPLIGQTDRSAGDDVHEQTPDLNVTPPSPLPHSYLFPAPQQRDQNNKEAVGNRCLSEEGIDRAAVDLARFDREQTPTSLGAQLPAFLASRSDKTNAHSRRFKGNDYRELPTSHSAGGVVFILAVLGVTLFASACALQYLFDGSIIKASNSLAEIMRSYGSPHKNNAKAARKDVVATPSNPLGDRPVTSSEPVPSAPITEVPPSAAAGSVAASLEPRKIQTVPILPDQSSSSLAAPRDPLLLDDEVDTPNSASSPEPSTFAAQPVRPNAPVPIVPTAEGSDVPPSPARAHASTGTRSREPRLIASASAPRPTLNAGNVAPTTVPVGYAVQLAARRSSASARAAFRALQTKFPSQLEGREPIVRRVDLGTKGVYYRALIGPFTSAEAATGACITLKAAGGNCIVQRLVMTSAE